MVGARCIDRSGLHGVLRGDHLDDRDRPVHLAVGLQASALVGVDLVVVLIDLDIGDVSPGVDLPTPDGVPAVAVLESARSVHAATNSA